MKDTELQVSHLKLKIFCLKIGYKKKESGSVASNGVKKSEVWVKLQDIPEMGYTSKDQPYARGLLWVKTPEMSPGYYCDEENNKKNYDSEGYFNTGDVRNFQFFFPIF